MDKQRILQLAEVSRQKSNEWRNQIIASSLAILSIILLIPVFVVIYFIIAWRSKSLAVWRRARSAELDNADSIKRAELVKRMFDYTLALVLIVLLSPVFAVMFVAVKWTSRGRVIFKQERLGKNCTPFIIYKFRSMRVDAEVATGPVIAAERDSRTTPIGNVIRSSRLDELPQLFNILRGDMSFVGPRPEREYFVNKLSKLTTKYMSRFSVKPGVTGLAQINIESHYDVYEKLRLDLEYIQKRSMMNDMKIILKTLILAFQQSCNALIEKIFSHRILFSWHELKFKSLTISPQSEELRKHHLQKMNYHMKNI